MNLPKTCKIETCCADPKMNRAQFEQPFRNGDNIIATDGRVLVVVPCYPSPEDTDKVRVPVEAIKAARKLPNATIELGHTVKLSNGIAFPIVDSQAPIPPYQHAIPQAPATFKAVLSLASLTRVCAALGTDLVTIEFTGGSGEAAPIRVLPIKGHGNGYMMTGKLT